MTICKAQQWILKPFQSHCLLAVKRILACDRIRVVEYKDHKPVRPSCYHSSNVASLAWVWGNLLLCSCDLQEMNNSCLLCFLVEDSLQAIQSHQTGLYSIYGAYWHAAFMSDDLCDLIGRHAAVFISIWALEIKGPVLWERTKPSG